MPVSFCQQSTGQWFTPHPGLAPLDSLDAKARGVMEVFSGSGARRARKPSPNPPWLVLYFLLWHTDHMVWYGMIWYDLPTYCVVISYLKYLKVISYLKLLISYLRYLIDTHQQLSAPKHQLGHVLAEKSVQTCFKDASGSLGIRFIGSTYHS